MTKIYAHRGANQKAAENTRSAFDEALEYAIDGIETDVQLSRDEVAVLWHDRFLDKVGLPEKRIDDYAYAQLQQMNFSAHFSATATPQSLMTLQEFLQAYRRRCSLLIEVKCRDWESAARVQLKIRKTLELIGQGALASAGNADILVSSFHLDSLIYAHERAAQVSLVYNLEPEQTLIDARHALSAHPFLHGLCLPIEILDSAIVELLREHKKCIAVYTCNSERQIRHALALGVDILISDVPQYALLLRDQ
jgi:glycerophosphoryl diester phosphodiesterase